MDVPGMELRTPSMSHGVLLRLMIMEFILETRAIGEIAVLSAHLNGVSMAFSPGHHRTKRMTQKGQ